MKVIEKIIDKVSISGYVICRQILKYHTIKYKNFGNNSIRLDELWKLLRKLKWPL